MKAGRQRGEFFYRLYQSTEIYNLMKETTPKEIRTGEIRLFWLICGLLEDLNTVSSKEIVVLNREINGYTDSSTRSGLALLRQCNLIETHKDSNQFFSRSYINITDRGNYLKALIRDKINFNPRTILEKHAKAEAKKKKEAHTRRAKTRKATFKRMKAEGKPVNQHPVKK
jgi:hypothetical protein